MNRCMECRYPFYKGIKLSDQRYICSNCNPKLVKDMDEAKKQFLKARAIVKEITGKQTDVIPQMELLDYQELQKRAKHNGLVRGFYHRKEIISTERVEGKDIETKVYGEKSL